MRYHQALLMMPEGVDITDDTALLSQFNALVQGMTGQENNCAWLLANYPPGGA